MEGDWLDADDDEKDLDVTRKRLATSCKKCNSVKNVIILKKSFLND